MYPNFKNKNIKYYSAMNVGQINSNGNIDPQNALVYKPIIRNQNRKTSS